MRNAAAAAGMVSAAILLAPGCGGGSPENKAAAAQSQEEWLGKLKKFVQDYPKAEDTPDALMQLGSLFVRTEQPALARRAFRQCLELEGGAKWRWEIHQAQKSCPGHQKTIW